MQFIKGKNKKTPILFSSSIQAALDNEYGKSKLEAESILNRLQSENGNPVLFSFTKRIWKMVST